MSNIPSRYDWDFGINNDVLDKQSLIQSHIIYMLEKTLNMFQYKGLPDTIPQKDLERILQTTGYCGICEVNGNLYALTGGLGGQLNEYYRPILLTVANPYLNYNKQLLIDKDCILIKNDSFYYGLMPLFKKNATLLSEIELSFRIGIINSRILAIVKTDNDNAKESAKKLFSDIEDGKFAGVVGGSSFFENVDTQTFGTDKTSGLKSLIELYQYIKSNWLNELGISSNWNAKKENLNEAELDTDRDILPLILSMLYERQKACDKVNEMYGTNWSVDFSENWKDTVKDILQNTEVVENDNNET